MKKSIILAAILISSMATAAPFNALVGPKDVNFINDDMISSGVPVVVSPFNSPKRIEAVGVHMPPADSEFSDSVVEAELNGLIFDVLRAVFEGTGFTVIENSLIADLNVKIDAKGQHIAKIVDLIAKNNGLEYSIDWENKVVSMRPAKVISRIYKVDILPITRVFNDNTSSGAVSSGKAGGVATTGDKNPWTEVSKTVDILLKGDAYANSTNSAIQPSFVLSEATGILTIFATEKTHNKVIDYLDKLHGVITKPIVIDIKIIEATFSDENSVGIQWDKVAQNVLAAPAAIIGNTGNTYANQSGILGGVAGGMISGNIPGTMALALNTGNLRAIVNAISAQTPINTLSEPLIYTLNNQSGIIRRGSEESYITGITVTPAIVGNGSTTPAVSTPTWTKIFSGLSLSVTPSVDREGNIMMHIHPSITSVTTVDKTFDGVLYPLAKINTKEQDIIIKAINGGTVVIGGVMSTELSHRESGIPVLKELPILGGLFRSSRDKNIKSELIILLKAQVVEPRDTMAFSKKIREKMMEEKIKSGTPIDRIKENHQDHLDKNKLRAEERIKKEQAKEAWKQRIAEEKALKAAEREAKKKALAEYKEKMAGEELKRIESMAKKLKEESTKKMNALMLSSMGEIAHMDNMAADLSSIKMRIELSNGMPFEDRIQVLRDIKKRLADLRLKF